MVLDRNEKMLSLNQIPQFEKDLEKYGKSLNIAVLKMRVFEKEVERMKTHSAETSELEALRIRVGA